MLGKKNDDELICDDNFTENWLLAVFDLLLQDNDIDGLQRLFESHPQVVEVVETAAGLEEEY